MHDTSSWNAIIVDDEPDNLGVIELVLDFNDVKSRTATSGHECLQLMQEDPANILFIDIHMPVMDGFELLEKIRENTDWRHIPAIAVTAKAMENDRSTILAGGFDGYISKPINAMGFIDEVKGFLQKANVE